MGQGPLQVVQSIPTQDSCFDACFSEGNQNQVISAGGDSTLKIWNLGANAGPAQVLKGHSAEVQSCEMNHLNKRMVVSASMDKTVKVWNP